jgi:ribosomal protein L22
MENKEEKKTEEKPKTEETKTIEKPKAEGKETSPIATKLKVEESRTKGSAPPEAKKEEVKEKPKEVPKTTEKPKKTEAVVRGENIPISTKHSAAICRFIKNKTIEDAISDLEQVMRLKKAIPMKGEIPHRKGKGIMSGKFPQRAVSRFIILLKSLAANSNHNGLENPAITEAVANIGERPYGRFGRVRKKRSHVRITAKSKKIKETKSKKRNADEDTSRVKKTRDKK